MKRQLLLMVLVAFGQIAAAQTLPVTVSPPFEEPKDAESKVFQCRGGNTILFGFTSGGLRIVVYDTSRKPIARNMIPVSAWGGLSMKGASAAGIFNIKDEVVVFIHNFSVHGPFSGGHSMLTRLSISPQDGKLLSHVKLAEDRGSFVQQAPGDDGYTVGLTGSVDEERHLLVIRFDGTHHEVGRDSFASPDERLKYVQFGGMALKAPDEGIFCGYGYNTRKSGGKESRLEIIAFRNGQFRQFTIDSADDLRNTDAALCYNRKSDLYELVTATAEGAEGGFFQSSKSLFSSLVIGIRARDLQIAFAKSLDEHGLNTIIKERFGEKAEYAGLPINTILGEDGTLTVITQTMSVSVSDHNTITTELGFIGILRYDDQGSLMSSALVPNAQVVWRAQFNPLYQKGEDVSLVWPHQAEGGIYLGTATAPGYYYSRFVSTSKGSFVFLNEHKKDQEHSTTEAATGVREISTSNAVGLRIAAGEEQTKFAAFGEPDNNSFQNRFALFSSGNYDAQTGDFAVVIVERQMHGEKKARIAWVRCK